MKIKTVLHTMIFMLMLTAVSVFGGCEKDLEITGVSFESKQYVYDGEEKTLTVSGDTDDCVVVYKDNKATLAGTYLATAIIKKSGYEELTLQATLEILKRDSTVTYDTEQTLLLGEPLPELSSDTGTMGWINARQKLEIGENTLQWSYTPNDSRNENSKTGETSIKVLAPESRSDTKKALLDNISTIESNVFNKFGTSLTYAIDEEKDGNKLEFADYYVPLFDNIYELTDNITLNGTAYQSGELVTLSIGNNSFIKDNAWVVKDNTLYVATPVLASYLDQNITLSLYGYDFTNAFGESMEKATINSLSFGNKTSEVVQNEDVYNVTLKNGNDMLAIYIEGVDSSSIALTKKTYRFEGQAEKCSYGFTTMLSQSGNPLGLYLMYGATEEDNDKDYTLIYDIFVLGLGKLTITINVDIDIPASE